MRITMVAGVLVTSVLMSVGANGELDPIATVGVAGAVGAIDSTIKEEAKKLLWQQAVGYYNDSDIPQAVELLAQLGQEFDHGEAANALGAFYIQGQVVPRDYARAMEWLQLAVEHGNVVAQYNLGVMSFNGYGNENDEPNYNQAFYWFEKSAQQEFRPGYMAVAKCHYYGIGTEEDKHQAFTWFLKAAERGNEEAMSIVASLYSRNYSSSLPRPLAWIMLVFGINQKKNFSQAFYWMQRAAIRGSAAAQYNVSIMYDRGIGTRKDEALSLQYLNNAVEQKYAKAVARLKQLNQEE